VADAVRSAVSVAVREAIAAAVVELLRHPEVVRALRPAEAAPARPGLLGRLTRLAGRAAAWALARLAPAARLVRKADADVRARLTPACSAATGAVRRGWRYLVRPTARLMTSTAVALLAAWKLRRQVVPATAVGLAAGLASFAAGPAAASVASGLVSAALSLACAALRLPRRSTAPAAVGA
jgi:hypothetical protein